MAMLYQLAHGLTLTRGVTPELSHAESEYAGDRLQVARARAAALPVTNRAAIQAESSGELRFGPTARASKPFDSRTDRHNRHADTKSATSQAPAEKFSQAGYVIEKSMSRQRRARAVGTQQQMSTEWKDAVRKRLDDLGHDHRWLEKQIGASTGMVAKMLSKEQTSSVLVPKVCQVLDLPPPTVEVKDPLELELLRGWRSMSKDEQEHWLALMVRSRHKADP